jgi:hypothetical protein
VALAPQGSGRALGLNAEKCAPHQGLNSAFTWDHRQRVRCAVHGLLTQVYL